VDISCPNVVRWLVWIGKGIGHMSKLTLGQARFVQRQVTARGYTVLILTSHSVVGSGLALQTL